MARTTTKTKSTAPSAQGTKLVKALGIEFEVPTNINENDQHLIPTSNPSYIYQEISTDVAMDVQENEIPLLVGLPSAGKTSFPKQLAALVGMPLVPVSCNPDMTVASLLGEWKYIKGEMVWVDGPLVKAMRHGYWLLLDEIDYCTSKVLGALNMVTEPISASSPERKILLPDNFGEVVVAKPSFRIIATSNTIGNMQKYRRMFPNAQQMNVAFIDRCNVHLVEFMSVEQETDQIMGHFGYDEPVRPYIAKFCQLAHDCREAFKNEELGFIFTTRRLRALLANMGRHKERHIKANMTEHERILDAAQRTVFTICNEADKQVISGHIKRVFESKKK